MTDDDNKKTSDGWRQRDFFFMASCIDGKLQCTECKIGSLVALLLAPRRKKENIFGFLYSKNLALLLWDNKSATRNSKIGPWILVVPFFLFLALCFLFRFLLCFFISPLGCCNFCLFGTSSNKNDAQLRCGFDKKVSGSLWNIVIG